MWFELGIIAVMAGVAAWAVRKDNEAERKNEMQYLCEWRVTEDNVVTSTCGGSRLSMRYGVPGACYHCGKPVYPRLVV